VIQLIPPRAGQYHDTHRGAFPGLTTGLLGAIDSILAFDPEESRDDSGKWTTGGGGEPWQQSKKAYEKYDTLPDPKDDTPENQKKWDDYFKRGREWEQSVQEAMSEGKLPIKDAQARGYHMNQDQDDTGKSTWQPLPADLYHVTTGASQVAKDGLKSRVQQGVSEGKGLGGGDSTTISFTQSKDVARTIYDTMHEALKVANGEISVDRLLDDAKEGKGAKRPFLGDMMRYFNPNWEAGKPLPVGVQAIREGRELHYDVKHQDDLPPGGKFVGQTWKGGGDKDVGNLWSVPASEDRIRSDRFDLYKNFLFMREAAGGPENPLFFGTDEKALANIDPKDIAILHVQPKPGAMGYPMSALGEWRTHSGKAVNVVDSEKPKPNIYAVGTHEGRRRAGTPEAEAERL
jgi:hypothetical protein